MELDETQSFSKIQTQLFIRYCAKQEVKKALDIHKKHEYKPFTELIMVRIMKNNIKDHINTWKKYSNKAYYKLFSSKPQ